VGIEMNAITRPILFALFVSACTGTATADPWAEQMVESKKIDFGVIATGSEAKKFVEITNVHNEIVHIASVSTTCGCSAATAGKQTLQPGEKTSIEVKMNTQKFQRRKDSNLIVKFDSPRYTEVRIPITAYIRTDVVFKPGYIGFGDVEVGNEGKAVIVIEYAGRPDWDIKDIKIANKNLKGVLSAPERNGGLLKHTLTMTLSKDAKPGRLRDVVTIVTNDVKNPYVPLMVEGVVVPDFSVTPATVAVRPMAPGQTARVQVVVKGKKPFQIKTVDCAGMEDCFKATLVPREQKVHVVPIEFNAPDRPGRFDEELVVQIDGRPEPLRFHVTGTITN